MIEGFILRTLDYQDHNKLLYIYTNQGIKSVLARGVKKLNSPFRHLTQSGHLISFEASKGNLPTLKNATLLNRYQTLKQDIVKITMMHVVCELIYYNLTDDDDHEKLFNFLKKVLNALNDTPCPEDILMIFELKFFHFLGYGINLKHCQTCQTKHDLWFDVNSASLVCQQHAIKTHTLIGPKHHQILTWCYYIDIETYQPLQLEVKTTQVLFDVIEALQTMHMGTKPKSKAILRTLLTGGTS